MKEHSSPFKLIIVSSSSYRDETDSQTDSIPSFYTVSAPISSHSSPHLPVLYAPSKSKPKATGVYVLNADRYKRKPEKKPKEEKSPASQTDRQTVAETEFMESFR